MKKFNQIFTIFIISSIVAFSFHAVEAGPELITNGDFETGDFTSWTLFTTQNGRIDGPGPGGNPTVVIFDTDGDGTSTFSARFNVAEVVFQGAGAGGGILQDVTTDGGDVMISADIAARAQASGNSSCSKATLFFDGVAVDIHDFAFCSTTLERAQLSATIVGVAPGTYEVKIEMTRPFITCSSCPLQYIDNVSVFTGELQVEPEVEKKSGGGDNQWDTRPSFGISHETRQDQIVENGFKFNSEYFTLTDNHHTDFAEQSVDIGTLNSFSATVYASNELKIQEFLFGIPNVGEAHLAELGVEVWYDRDGNIEDVIVVQKSDVIDADTVSVSHEKTKCLSTDADALCDTTTVSMIFLEPLADKVMAIKAIDYALRDQRTFLNDGFDISGESLNPMLSSMIPSNVRGEGLLQVTQVAKYSPYWVAEDGRMFEMNSFGSFKEINQSFERFHDTGDVKTRVHSEFGSILAYEQNRAQDLFDSTKLIAELPDTFTHHFEIDDRFNEEMMQEMLLQQEIANAILEEMDRQDRHY